MMRAKFTQKHNNERTERMKNKTIVKIIATVAALAALSAMAFAVSATDTEATKPDIFSQNVEYGEKFSLMYAVDASTVTGDTVTLTVTGGDTAWSQTIDATEENQQTIKDRKAYVFTTPGVGPQDFATQYTVTATSGDATSEAKRYSIAEYLGEQLYKNGYATPGKDEIRKEFYLSTLEFAANMGKVLNIDTNPNNNVDHLVTEYYYVYTDLGTIDGAYSAGVYLDTDSITFTPADATKKYQICTIGADGSVDEDAGVEIAGGETFTVSANSVIVEKPSYKVGSGKFVNMVDNFQTEIKNKNVRYVTFDSTTTTTVLNVSNTSILTRVLADGASSHQRLTGSNDAYIRVDNTDAVAPETAFITVSEFDMMYSGFSVPTDPAYFVQIRVYDGDESTNSYIKMVRNSDGTISIAEKDSVKIAADEWFNIRLEIAHNSDGSATIDIYVNNTYVASQNVADFAPGCKKTWLLVRPYAYDSSAEEQGTIYIDNVFMGHIDASYKTVNEQ